MTSHILKYGDLILIQGSLQSTQSSKKDAQNNQGPESSGFLSAIGYTDTRVFLQTVPKGITSTSEQLKVASDWSNYRELVFQVWPKVSYEAHKQMKKLRREKALMVNVTDDAKTAFDEKMKKMRNRVEEEVEGNKKMISHFLGHPVVYGAEIQLMHFNSESFLASRVACSDSDKSAYKFELVNEFNSGMAFKFLPRFQIRQEGDPVQLRDQVLLFSMKMKCYVNFANDKPIEIDEKMDIPANLPVITAPFEHRKMTKGPQRYEAFVSQTCDCVWKVHYYGRHIEVADSIVRGGDLIKLKHTEIDAYLAADIAVATTNPEVFGQKYNDDYEFKEEYNNINTVWEVEREGFESRGETCSVTEDLAKPQSIKLRHLLTGKVLSVENVGGEKLGLDARTRSLAVASKSDAEGQQKKPAVIFKSFANNDSQDLTYNVAYAIGVSDGAGSFKYVKALESEEVSVKKQGNNSAKQGASTSLTVFKPLDENESPAKKTFMLCENVDPNPEHAFMLIKVTLEEESQINFVASSVCTLKYFRDLVKSCKTADINPNAVTKTLGVLKDLIFFVHKVDDTEDQEEVDPVEYEGITVDEKQRLVKDFKVIDLLTEILYYPFQRQLISLEDLQNEGLRKIFQYCYRLIKHIIKEYRPNEIYASQWLEYYMDQAMKSTAESDIKAEATLIELIDNNKKILDDKINTDMIFKFVGMLRENKSEKFVNLLRALCVCDGEPVVANQTDMSRFIIEDKTARDHLIYQNFRRNNGKVEVRVKEYESGTENWFSLQNFQVFSKEADQEEKYEYFISMIYLLADLCLGRNYIAMDFLQTVYTYDICFQIINDDLSNFELKSAFARLINNLWLDRKPYQPLNIPQYLILWDEITPTRCNQIACTEVDASWFDGLKDYLKAHFSKLAKEGCNRIYEVERNKFTSITLEIATRLVNFGFYTNVEQLKDLLRPLLIILNGMKDVMSHHDYETFKKKLKQMKKPKKTYNIGTSDLDERNTQRYEENERTNIVMNCKNQICQLIKIILNIDDDLRLRQYLLEFKNELNATKGKDNDVSEFGRSPDRKSLFSNYKQKLFKGNDEDTQVDFVKSSLDWIQGITERNPIDLKKLAPTNFVKILFDLCLYDHEDLVSNSFELLNNTHSQRMRLKEMLEKVHILEDPEKKKAVEFIEEDIKALWELAETTEIWYEKKDAESSDSAKKCVLLVKKLGGYLVNDSLLMRGQNPEPDAEIITKSNTLNSPNPFEEDDAFEDVQGVDSEFQTILRNLKVHEPLLNILEYESKREGDKTNEVRMAVIREICKLLSKFAYGTKTNQALLMDHMSIFLTVLTRYTSSGVDELIEVLFKNNRALVRQIDEVQKFAKSFLRIISKLKLSHPKSAKMLMSLEPFMRYKSNVIKANQTAILNLITQKENSDIFMTIDPKKTTRDEILKDDIFKKLEAFNNAVEHPNGLVDLPAELDYLSSLFEIMSCTCAGKNAVTESRSQNAWPMTNLTLLYEKSEECWLLKRSILLFVYHVYLDTERGLREGSALHKLIFGAMIKDMESIPQNCQSKYEIRYHKGSMDNKQAQESFYFDAILPCVNDILGKRFYAEVNNYSGKLTQMFNALLQMKQLFLSRAQRQALKHTIDKFRIHAHEVYTAGLEHAKLDNLEIADLSRDAKRMSIGGSSSMMNGKEEDTKNLKLKMRLNMLGDREEFLESTEEEFEHMVSILIDIEKQEDNNIYSSLIPFNEVIQSLIKLVSKPKQDKKLTFVGLKTIRKIIERENKDDTQAAADWDGDTWARYEKKIVFRQNELCSLGIVDMICEIMSRNDDLELQNECILVGIAMLLGGNIKVQKAFCDYIQSDAQNDFMFTIKDLIDKNFDLVKKEMSLKNRFYLDRLYEIENALLTKKGIKSLTATPHKGSSLEMGASQDFDDDNEDLPLESAMPDIEEAQQSLLVLQRIYRFLQLFCEGHNLQMQDQLREQTDKKGNVNGKSQDFISRTAYYFNTLIKQINVDSLDFGVQMLDFLIEAMQGPCEKNQQALVKAKIINSCMDFLMTFKQERDYHKQGFTESSHRARVNDATTTATKLLNTLIEGSNNPEIIEEMGSLDFKFLIFKLSQEYETFVRENLKLNVATVSPSDVTAKLNANSFNKQILESFDVYILMANLADANPKVASFLKNTEDYSELEKAALEFFRTNLADIEIMFGTKLLKIYFPIYPICRYLSRDSRKDLMANVDRDSPNEKIMGLVNAGPELFDEMSHMAFLKNQIFVFNQKRYNLLRDISTLLSLLINVIILSVSYYSMTAGVSLKKTDDIGELSSEQTINVLGYLQIVTSSLMIVFWIIINSPIILSKKWREFIKQHKPTDEKDDILAYLDEEPNPEELPLSVALELLARKGPYDPIFNPDGKRNYGHLFVRLVCYWNNIIFIMSEGKFVFMVFYLIVSIMGVAISEITYCFHLLDVINRFDTLRNVVRSVTHNLNQLLLTGLLGIILIYIYALIGFYFIDEMYYNSDAGDGGERSCTSMFHCYMTTLNYGLRNGGGIGESLTYQSYVSDNRVPYFFRLVFDLSFFIIINVVFLNIIFGIIIDTFAELRDKKSSVDEDMKTICFICNLDRYTFDKNGKGFENHIEKHHHLWNYLFFIYSINAKDATEYNGIESYVQGKLQAEDASWFPLHKAIELESGQEE